MPPLRRPGAWSTRTGWQRRASDRADDRRPVGQQAGLGEAAPPGRRVEDAAQQPRHLTARPDRSALAACPGPPPPVVHASSVRITSGYHARRRPTPALAAPAAAAARRAARLVRPGAARPAVARARRARRRTLARAGQRADAAADHRRHRARRVSRRSSPASRPWPAWPRPRSTTCCMPGRAWATTGARAPLHACAQAVVEHHGGRLPLDRDALLELPGIGPYTAAAVAAIAGGAAGGAGRRQCRAGAGAAARGRDAAAGGAPAAARGWPSGLPPRHAAGDFAQALMELGALVCTPRRPACLACPWQPLVPRRGAGEPERYPAQGGDEGAASRCSPRAFLLERADGRSCSAAGRGRPARRHDRAALDTVARRSAAGGGAVGGTAAGDAPGQPVPGEVRHLFTHIDLTLSACCAAGAASADADGCGCRRRASASWPCRP